MNQFKREHLFLAKVLIRKRWQEDKSVCLTEKEVLAKLRQILMKDNQNEI